VFGTSTEGVETVCLALWEVPTVAILTVVKKSQWFTNTYACKHKHMYIYVSIIMKYNYLEVNSTL
jgi:hypothetical protein